MSTLVGVIKAVEFGVTTFAFPIHWPAGFFAIATVLMLTIQKVLLFSLVCALMSCQGGDLAVRPKLRFTSGNTTEAFRYYEESFGRPWHEIEVKYPPECAMNPRLFRQGDMG